MGPNAGFLENVGADSGILEERTLHITLELGYSDCCMLEDIEGETTDVSAHIVNDTCQCDVSISDEKDESDGPRLVHTSQELESACVCSVFHRHGCVPHITELAADTFFVVTYLPSRETLKRLVEELRETTDPVRLVRIADTGDGEADGGQQNVLFDLTILTRTQRETLETAVMAGYYDKPREIEMQDLADDLGISKATLSYRLKTAESKIVNSLISSEKQESPGEE